MSPCARVCVCVCASSGAGKLDALETQLQKTEKQQEERQKALDKRHDEIQLWGQQLEGIRLTQAEKDFADACMRMLATARALDCSIPGP